MQFPGAISLQAGDKDHMTPAATLSWPKAVNDLRVLAADFNGKNVTLYVPGSNFSVKGTLLYRGGNTGMIRSREDHLTVFNWDAGYLLSADSAEDDPAGFAARAPDTLGAGFDLKAPAAQARLSYLNPEVSLANHYRLIRHPDGTVSLSLRAVLNNDSAISYRQALLTLATGDNNDRPPGPLYRQMAGTTGASLLADRVVSTQRSGGRQFITPDGLYDLPARSSLVLNVLSQSRLPALYRYRYSFNGSAGTLPDGKTEHPQTLLSFTTSRDLPGGRITTYTTGAQGTLLLTGESNTGAVAAGSRVQLTQGRAYTVDIQRRRITLQRQSGETGVHWQLKLTSHDTAPVTLVIRDTSPLIIGSSATLVQDKPSVQALPLEKEAGNPVIVLSSGETRTVDLNTVYYNRSS